MIFITLKNCVTAFGAPCKDLYCLRHVTGSFKNAVQNWILQIKPSPSLLLGSRVELHSLAHAQIATLNCIQRLSPKKGASDIFYI